MLSAACSSDHKINELQDVERDLWLVEVDVEGGGDVTVCGSMNMNAMEPSTYVHRTC